MFLILQSWSIFRNKRIHDLSTQTGYNVTSLWVYLFKLVVNRHFISSTNNIGSGCTRMNGNYAYLFMKWVMLNLNKFVCFFLNPSGFFKIIYFFILILIHAPELSKIRQFTSFWTAHGPCAVIIFYELNVHLNMHIPTVALFRNSNCIELYTTQGK